MGGAALTAALLARVASLLPAKALARLCLTAQVAEEAELFGREDAAHAQLGRGAQARQLRLRGGDLARALLD